MYTHIFTTQQQNEKTVDTHNLDASEGHSVEFHSYNILERTKLYRWKTNWLLGFREGGGKVDA